MNGGPFFIYIFSSLYSIIQTISIIGIVAIIIISNFVPIKRLSKTKWRVFNRTIKRKKEDTMSEMILRTFAYWQKGL